MSKVYSWEDKLAEADKYVPKAIEICNEYFNSEFSKSTLELDKLGSDINNGTIHVDIKLNDYDSTNFIAEWGNDYKKGWSIDETKITTYLLWVTTEDVFLINYEPIRKACIKNRIKMITKYGCQDAYSSSNFGEWACSISLIPMEEIKKHVIKVWNVV
jgi:hypothetical protein